MRRLLVLGLLSLALASPGSGQQPAPERPLGTLRQQAEVRQAWLKARLETALPRLMRENGVDMWIVAMREYHEDPVFRALVSPTTYSARRRTIYVFYDRGAERGVERLALGGGSQGGLYQAIRETERAPDGQQRELWGKAQWDLLARVVRERNPRKIALDISQTHAFSDGLTLGEWEQLQEALGPELLKRVVRAERLPLDYLAIRVPEMLPTYRRMQEIVHQTIATAFSRQVITPGVTTTDDVVWWMMQRVNDLGLGTWFQTSVEVQRRGVNLADSVAPVIQRGDVLHCDFGITALGLNTDTQHMGYVPREGETDAPAGLKHALAVSNRLQDILLSEMRPGLSGNEVLKAALARMRTEGIDGSIYTHPIGDHGHAAGPLIGLWDRQDGVPGRGDVPLLPNMWHSIELQATTPVPEWGNQPVRMAQEEDAEMVADGTMRWILDRQTELHLVR
jgi:Xaa-Pro aminopeptidase